MFIKKKKNQQSAQIHLEWLFLEISRELSVPWKFYLTAEHKRWALDAITVLETRALSITVWVLSNPPVWS